MAHHSRKSRSTEKQVREYRRRMKKAFKAVDSTRFKTSTSATGKGVHIRWKYDDESGPVAVGKSQATPTPLAVQDTLIDLDVPKGPVIGHRESSFTRTGSIGSVRPEQLALLQKKDGRLMNF